MARIFGIVPLLLLLAGCTGAAPPAYGGSPCAAGEASYECQVYRYQMTY